MSRMQRTIERWTARCGRPLSIVSSGTRTECYGFLQPLRYKNKMYLDNDYLPGGYAESGHFLYLGPPDIRLDRMTPGTQIAAGTESYTVKRAECVYWGGKPLYVWAVLQPWVGEELDDTE